MALGPGRFDFTAAIFSSEFLKQAVTSTGMLYVPQLATALLLRWVSRCQILANRSQGVDGGGKPHWRCTVEPRHREPVRRQHLQLPEMRSLIPAKQLRRFERPLSA